MKVCIFVNKYGNEYHYDLTDTPFEDIDEFDDEQKRFLHEYIVKHHSGYQGAYEHCRLYIVDTEYLIGLG